MVDHIALGQVINAFDPPKSEAKVNRDSPVQTGMLWYDIAMSKRWVIQAFIFRPDTLHPTQYQHKVVLK